MCKAQEGSVRGLRWGGGGGGGGEVVGRDGEDKIRKIDGIASPKNVSIHQNACELYPMA